MPMSTNLGQKQKYELHEFIKNPGKCVKIRDIPVTIDANVRNFGTNRNMNYMHLLKIQENV
jgi:hypothetical protein